ncbi:hypothetical protein ACIGNX_16915 [Actinosynnema sp. NPDC053489]|uniref:hypothetical protein n=1 Tax=Actinosynnema sp. NPDC053489 TaxID=3363916 RepID=UPI0037CBFF98
MTTTTAKTRVPLLASIPLALGLAALAAVVASPAAAIVVGTAVALVALVRRALVRASHRLDSILEEELDR